MINIRKFLTGIGLLPVSSTAIDTQGELEARTSDGQLYYHDGSTASKILTASNVGGSTLSNPITVPNGGTGDVTLTAHGVLIGAGSSTINVTGTGTAGQVLTSNGSGADPTFQASGGGGTVTVPNGGTGDTSFVPYAVITGGTTSTAPLQSVVSVGTIGQILTSNGTGALPTFQSLSFSAFTKPTIQKFTSGTAAAYTTPSSPSPLYLKIRLVGAGGGSGGPSGPGSPGGHSNFGPTGNVTAIFADGGGGGRTGGTVSSGTAGNPPTFPAIGTGYSGSGGLPGTSAAGGVFNGGNGGSSAFFMCDSVPASGVTGTANSSPPSANTGAGGAGSVNSSVGQSGGAGGGGVEAYITGTLAATYTYTVGIGGATGDATHGSPGSDGYIEVTEFYQ